MAGVLVSVLGQLFEGLTGRSRTVTAVDMLCVEERSTRRFDVTSSCFVARPRRVSMLKYCTTACFAFVLRMYDMWYYWFNVSTNCKQSVRPNRVYVLGHLFCKSVV